MPCVAVDMLCCALSDDHSNVFIQALLELDRNTPVACNHKGPLALLAASEHRRQRCTSTMDAEQQPFTPQGNQTAGKIPAELQDAAMAPAPDAAASADGSADASGEEQPDASSDWLSGMVQDLLHTEVEYACFDALLLQFPAELCCLTLREMDCSGQDSVGVGALASHQRD